MINSYIYLLIYCTYIQSDMSSHFMSLKIHLSMTGEPLTTALHFVFSQQCLAVYEQGSVCSILCAVLWCLLTSVYSLWFIP